MEKSLGSRAGNVKYHIGSKTVNYGYYTYQKLA